MLWVRIISHQKAPLAHPFPLVWLTFLPLATAAGAFVSFMGWVIGYHWQIPALRTIFAALCPGPLITPCFLSAPEGQTVVHLEKA